MAQRVKNMTSTQKDVGSIPASMSGLRLQCRSHMWLWHRLAATTLVQLLAWELPYTAGTALKKKQTNKQKKLIKNTRSSLVVQWVKDLAVTAVTRV